jgi:hypothetical protein
MTGCCLLIALMIIPKGILKTLSLMLFPTAITCNRLLLKSRHRLRSFTMAYPTAWRRCSWSMVSVFLTMLAYRMTRLFFSLKECSVK